MVELTMQVVVSKFLVHLLLFPFSRHIFSKNIYADFMRSQLAIGLSTQHLHIERPDYAQAKPFGGVAHVL